MDETILLREVVDEDLPIFFAQQQNPDANYLAAFTAKNPADYAAFMAHWERNLATPTNITRTIECAGQVVGHIASYVESDAPEITYWIGKEYWGQGIATSAVRIFLKEVNTTRPMRARVAKDNPGSFRVLQKCGFRIIGEDRGYANARGKEIEEWLLQLTADAEHPWWLQR